MCVSNQFYWSIFPTEYQKPIQEFTQWCASDLQREFKKRYSKGKTLILFREFGITLDNKECFRVMAGKSSTKKSTTNTGFKPTVWASIPLNEEDKSLVMERAGETEEILGGLIGIFVDGFDVFIKHRDNNQSVQCTLVGAHPVDDGKNIGLSAFAPDLWTALSAICFKYIDVAGRDLSPFCSDQSGGIG